MLRASVHHNGFNGYQASYYECTLVLDEGMVETKGSQITGIWISESGSGGWASTAGVRGQQPAEVLPPQVRLQSHNGRI